MLSPIFGGFYVSRSTNLADQQSINIFPTVVDTRTGKAVGALYNTAGLRLLQAVGAGPIRECQVFKNVLYVLSGNSLYSVTAGTYVATLIGTIMTSVGPVSIITNSTQMVIFDGVNGYLIPGGSPLTGGTILNPGTLYEVDDLIKLQASDGTQNATAQIQVSSVAAGGVVTGFVVTMTGAFDPLPTQFTQAATDGAGVGFQLSAPTYGVAVPIYTLTLPFSGPVSASYQDGFGVVNESQTQKWWQSDLFDLSYWDPLNFSSADAQPDDIVAIAQLHEQQFLFKSTNIEVWINAGLPGFAFQRLPGVHIEVGCAASFSVALVGESLVWLSRDDQGAGNVHMLSGYEAKKISTKAIDTEIQSYGDLSDAIAYSYEQDGHLYYVLIFPSASKTWVYDASVGLWHSRAAFSNGQFYRHWSNCFVLYGTTRIVGDYRNGNIYAYDPAYLTDNGTPKKWVRSWRALKEPMYTPMSFESLQIDMQTGIAVPSGTNPQVVLRWSDDGGHNWSNERFMSAGRTGETAIRVKSNRLGATKYNKGLDRIFEISSTDAFPVAVLNAELL